MPSLILEHSGKRTGASLNGRTSIGRGDDSGIVVDHPTVSRIHAWIENDQGKYFITDTGSRNGTFVDGERIDARKSLRDGSVIRVGPVRMIFRIAPLSEIAPRMSGLPAARPQSQGIVFSCACGAKLWVPQERAGETGRCKRCGEAVQFPIAQDLEVVEVEPQAQTSTATAFCSICQCEMYEGERVHTCPACGLAFHADCWAENKGCSAYGCSQVNVLAENEPLEDDAAAEEHEPLEEHHHRIGWELGFLLVSVPLSVLGAILFGVLPLVGAVFAALCLKHDQRSRRKILALLAIAIMLAGALLGMVFSMSFWFKVPFERWLGR